LQPGPAGARARPALREPGTVRLPGAGQQGVAARHPLRSAVRGAGRSQQALPQGGLSVPSRDGAAEDKVGILLVDDRPDKLIVLEAILAELGEDLVKATS